MAKWVQFSRPWDYVPRPDKRHQPQTISYRHDGEKNGVYSIPDDQAAKAVEDGAAVEIAAPATREERAALQSGEAEPKAKPAGGKG